VEGTDVAATALSELQALEFVLTELALYLDTHPDDQEAFALFQQYTALEEEARASYEQMYGPLTHMGAAKGDRYTWLEGTWPWHYEKGGAN
jgi:spore coat protein JB